MFDIFKKKVEKESNDVSIFSMVDGEVININQVSDPVFSEKMMGDGFAIIPNNGEIYSPVVGIVESIFPTKHAIGLKTDSNIDVLVHMGVDTVDLKGEPFEILVSVGDKISKAHQIARVDLNHLSDNGKSNEMIVVFPEGEVSTTFNQVKFGKVSIGDLIGTLQF